ncbi:MAG: YceD family protein [Pseudomonadota bacterium]
MSKRLQVELNTVRLSANKSLLRGTVPLGQFKRFAEYVRYEQDGDVDVELKFNTGEANAEPLVDGWMAAEVLLECHRCGEQMPLSVDCSFRYRLVRNGSPDEHGGDYEPFPLDESGVIRSVDLLEDELILQVPLSPRHREGEQCTEVTVEPEYVAERDTLEPIEADNPFAVLKNLK